ncbi:MAG TPA: hypothetical protein VNX68_11215, partial [Nitrosopumilaceae archaeon]|nr:hypothetical protein [Nitrosopumilaceae archaeon]
ASIIEERLDDGNWYKEGKDEQVADVLTQEFGDLNLDIIFNRDQANIKTRSKNIYEQMLRFLTKRRLHEYEDWDILDTEN